MTMTAATKFITWPRAIDADFRAQYAAVTNETIQDSPAANATHFLAGSSRLTGGEADTLQTAFPDIAVSDSMPQGWNETEEE